MSDATDVQAAEEIERLVDQMQAEEAAEVGRLSHVPTGPVGFRDSELELANDRKWDDYFGVGRYGADFTPDPYEQWGSRT